MRPIKHCSRPQPCILLSRAQKTISSRDEAVHPVLSRCDLPELPERIRLDELERASRVFVSSSLDYRQTWG